MGRSKNNVRKAAVCATRHDWPTRFAYPAAKEVGDLLKEWQSRVFLPYLSGDGNWKRRLENDATAFRLGYFSAHGTNPAKPGYVPGLVDDAGAVFFTACDSDVFSDAILVFSSCLANDGELAKELVSKRQFVRAVIGYKGRKDVKDILAIPAEEACRKWKGRVFDLFHRRFLAALVEPIRSLTRTGVTVDDAVKETWRRWIDLLRDTLLPERLKSIAARNLRNFFQEGHGDASVW